MPYCIQNKQVILKYDEIFLDSLSLDQLQIFVDTLIKNQPDDITKSQVYQAA